MATRISPLIPTGTWSVDPAFERRVLGQAHGIANVRGKFAEFVGTVLQS